MGLVAVLKSEEERSAPKTERKEFVAKADGKVNDQPGVKADPEPPLSIYEKMRERPYTAEYFKLTDWDALTDELDVLGTKEKARTVEEWVKEKIKREKLEDTTETYNEILDQYKDELGIKKTLKNDEKLDRIVKYIALLKKQRKLDERKRELLGL